MLRVDMVSNESQSELMYPFSFHSPRITRFKRSGSPHVGLPLTSLYEHITLATFPSKTQLLNGG
ncbi:hypothetical protein HanRHA438_Chr17g0795251 [Helianthus annuus]|nr:hypothetical protein HanRHA438_Chr17g0795251 [Helianthus annuus]